MEKGRGQGRLSVAEVQSGRNRARGKCQATGRRPAGRMLRGWGEDGCGGGWAARAGRQPTQVCGRLEGMSGALRSAEEAGVRQRSLSSSWNAPKARKWRLWTCPLLVEPCNVRLGWNFRDRTRQHTYPQLRPTRSTSSRDPPTHPCTYQGPNPTHHRCMPTTQHVHNTCHPHLPSSNAMQQTPHAHRFSTARLPEATRQGK